MKENFGAQPERLNDKSNSFDEPMFQAANISLEIAGGTQVDRNKVEDILAQLRAVLETETGLDPEKESIMRTDIRILSSYLQSEEMSS